MCEDVNEFRRIPLFLLNPMMLIYFKKHKCERYHLNMHKSRENGGTNEKKNPFQACHTW